MNIKTDSRKVVSGDTYVALRGITGDGHNYIDKAIKNGASKIVCEEGSYDIETIIVPDTRLYLTELLKDEYKKIIEEMTIIALTGTNGKTTTAFLLYDALNKLGKKCAYIGTIGFYLDKKIRNLDNTTPEVSEIYSMILEAYENGFKHMVIEASSQGLSYGRLDGLLFDYAIFTNLTQDHLDFHKTMENYALAKQKLFKQLKTNGSAIINVDDPYRGYFFITGNNNISYGFNEADYQISNYVLKNSSIDFSCICKGEDIKLSTNLIGKYNLYNVVAVIAVLKEIGYTVDDFKSVIPKLTAPVGRIDKIDYKSNIIIVDYAHTPDAVEKIINSTKDFVSGKIYAVFGCTGDRDKIKRPIMTKIVTDLVDKAILTIDDPHNEDIDEIIASMIDGVYNSNYEICKDRKEAIIKGIDLLNENDVLLILGKGHEEAIIIKDQKIPFNDKQVVLDYLKINDR